MATIAFEREEEAHRIPLAQIANTSAAISACYVCKLSKDLRRKDKSNLRIIDMMRCEPTEIFRVADLPPRLDPAYFPPSKTQLHKEQEDYSEYNPIGIHLVTFVNMAVDLSTELL